MAKRTSQGSSPSATLLLDELTELVPPPVELVLAEELTELPTELEVLVPAEEPTELVEELEVVELALVPLDAEEPTEPADELDVPSLEEVASSLEAELSVELSTPELLLSVSGSCVVVNTALTVMTPLRSIAICR